MESSGWISRWGGSRSGPRRTRLKVDMGAMLNERGVPASGGIVLVGDDGCAPTLAVVLDEAPVLRYRLAALPL